MLQRDLQRIENFVKKNIANEKILKMIEAIHELEPLHSKHPNRKLYVDYYIEIDKLLKELKLYIKEIKSSDKFKTQMKHIQSFEGRYKALKHQTYFQLRQYTTVKDSTREALVSSHKEAPSLNAIITKIQKQQFNDKDKNGRTTLMNAIMMNIHVKNLEAIIQNSAIDVNMKDTKGKTALTYAIESNNLDWVKLLLLLNANVDEQTVNLAKKHPEIYTLVKDANKKRTTAVLISDPFSKAQKEKKDIKIEVSKTKKPKND